MKDEGWWLLLGDASSGELIALRRLTLLQSKSSTTLTFEAPVQEGKYSYQLYFISDCYLGLDQQYDVSFVVKRSAKQEKQLADSAQYEYYYEKDEEEKSQKEEM